MGQRSEARGGVGAVAARSEFSGITRVLIRFGTSPTGISATTFIAFIKEAGVYMPVVFFDFDEKTKQPRWVHMGGRATKRV